MRLSTLFLAALLAGFVLPAPSFAQTVVDPTAPAAPPVAAKKKPAKSKTPPQPAPAAPAQPVETPPAKPGVGKADPREEAEAKRYLACLETAKNSPALALQSADAWSKAGGGPPAVHCAAVSLFEMKRYQEAALRFESLADTTPIPDVRIGALEQAAQAWFLAGRPEMAEKPLDTALAARPGDPELLTDRGIFRANQGRLNDAIADWTDALKKAPDRDDILTLRATAFRKTNQLAAAREDANRAVELNPKNPEALLERGTIRQMDGDTGGALEDWNQAKAVAPRSAAAQTADANIARANAAKPK